MIQEKIPVVFHGGRGSWDQSLIRQTIESDPIYEQFEFIESVNRKITKAIVLGQGDFEQLVNLLSSLDKYLFINTGDELNLMDFSKLPKHGKIWCQCWTTAHQAVDRHLLLGARYDTVPIIEGLNKEKKHLWSFVGQAQESRKHTYQIFERFKNGKLIKTTGFGGQNDGLIYPEYLQIFCNSKIVLCPMGNNCADTFRLYEAIEAGALPIVEGADYWSEFNIPFPCVSEWGSAEWIIADYELNPDKLIAHTEKTRLWWKDYKAKVLADIKTDICS